MSTIFSTTGIAIFVSLADMERASAHRWSVNTDEYGRHRVTAKIDGRTTVLSRFLIGCPSNKVIDHIDGNSLNNCRENLRRCSHSENLRNKRRYRNNASGFKGVYRYKPNGTWYTQLIVGGRRYRKYGFRTRRDAAKAYNKLAQKHHGTFAKLNQIV